MDKLNHLLEMVASLHEKFDKIKVETNNTDLLSEGLSLTIGENPNKEIFSLIPLDSMEAFNEFEEKLSHHGSFRKSFIKAMSDVGGRDCNVMVMQILRHSLTDETAQLFSLTGKKIGNFPAKRKFLGTQICFSIFDAVRKRFQNCTDDLIKNSMKNWFQQALTRLQRRKVV